MKKTNDNDLGKVKYSVPPVERALALLRYIGEGNKCRNITEVSSQLSINRTTLIRLIHTLLNNRMIEEIGDDEGYRLGLGTITLAAKAIQSRNIVQVSSPFIKELSLIHI